MDWLLKRQDDGFLAPTGYTPLAVDQIARENCVAEAATSEVEPDERIVFFATSAQRLPCDTGWSVPIHGRLYRPTHSGAAWTALTLALKSFGVSPSDDNRRIFDHRCALLLGDNQAGRRIVIAIAGRRMVMPPTGRDGQFREIVAVFDDDIAASEKPDRQSVPRVAYSAQLGQYDDRRFCGYAMLVPPRGVSVISDIDDTVKITHVAQRRRMLELTFLKAFEPVAGMARRFRQWSEDGAALHFVSSSPWPLYEPIETFLASAEFPDATVTLKDVGLKDRSIRNFLAKSTKTKPPAIEALLATYPFRRFVLIGDSVENDAEIYAETARRHPGRVSQVFIRATDDEAEPSRIERARDVLADVPGLQWAIYKDAAQLPRKLNPSLTSS